MPFTCRSSTNYSTCLASILGVNYGLNTTAMFTEKEEVTAVQVTPENNYTEFCCDINQIKLIMWFGPSVAVAAQLPFWSTVVSGSWKGRIYLLYDYYGFGGNTTAPGNVFMDNYGIGIHVGSDQIDYGKYYNAVIVDPDNPLMAGLSGMTYNTTNTLSGGNTLATTESTALVEGPSGPISGSYQPNTPILSHSKVGNIDWVVTADTNLGPYAIQKQIIRNLYYVSV